LDGLTVIGKLNEAEITKKASEIAMQQALSLPVIIFSNSLQQFKISIPDAELFEGEPGEQLSMLTDFRTVTTQPNYIVIASGDAVLGLTLFKRAYIIFTSAPDSLSMLRQMAGRGEREDINAAIVGTMLTSKRYSNLKDFELAVAGAEGK